MTETLAGVSPLKTENLLEEPSLAEAAVAGVRKAEPVAPLIWSRWRSRRRKSSRLPASWSVRPVLAGRDDRHWRDAQAVDQDGDRDRFGGGDDRSPRLRQARGGGPR